jgi:lysophospholipase
MGLTPAPLFDDMPGVPSGGAAHWVRTSDGVRIRVGHWRSDGVERGTVLMFPGRTEYIEKYGPLAAEMGRRGFATLSVDWRGQGLADRLIRDLRVGHVDQFPDFQKDVAAVVQLAQDLELPRPWHMIGHSMSGAIGLRAVIEGLPVETCVFTGPMWGIHMSAIMRPVGWAVSHLAPKVGLGARLAPSMKYEGYVTIEPFEGNTLTTDRAMYEMMQAHLAMHPELGLGGPSLTWLREALRECRHLASLPSPDMPCLTFLGAREQIVDCPAVHRRMDLWPNGQLDVIAEAEHEVLMEAPAIRARIFDRIDELFSGNHPS